MFYSFSLFFGIHSILCFEVYFELILIWTSGFNFRLWLSFFPCVILISCFIFKFLQLQNRSMFWAALLYPGLFLSGLTCTPPAIWTGHSQDCRAINWLVVKLFRIPNPQSFPGVLLILLEYIIKLLPRKRFTGCKFSKSLCCLNLFVLFRYFLHILYKQS